MKKVEKIKIIITAALATFFVAIIGFLLSSEGGQDGVVQINNSSVTGDDDSSDIVYEVSEKTLSVLPNKCRGCGKCIRIDPEHFSLSSSRTAEVISQENLDSTSLIAAISMCHDNAISLS